jgi:hypothetical protein
MATTEPKKAPAKAEPKPVLGSASASSDPAVHQLLAELEIHERNGNKGAAEACVKVLADLGYEI